MESQCPLYNRIPRKVIACKGGFPDLISKMVSHGVKVTNQNSGQGVRTGIVITCNYDGCCKGEGFESECI